MKTVFSHITTLFLLFFVFACESPRIKDDKRTAQTQTPFSLTTFAEAQKKQLLAALPHVKKQTKKTEKTLTSSERLWEEVFGSMEEADIFRPIFKARYAEEDLSETHFRYSALEESLNVREVELLFESPAKQNPKKITLRMQEENLLFQRKKEVQFTFEKGKLQTYSVRSNEDIRGLTPKETRLVLTVIQ